MYGDDKLKLRWEKLNDKLAEQFGNGAPLDMDSIIYLIGVQELGQFNRKFQKDEKVDLMHVAICTLLEPIGFYSFDYFDEEGWPHYKLKDNLPTLKPGEQSVMMKEAIVNYFLAKEYID